MLRQLINSYDRYQWIQIGWIVVAWTLTGTLDGLNTYAVTESGLVIGEASHTLETYLLVKITTAFIAGIFSGGLLIFFLRERVRRKPFGFALLKNGLIISLINFVIIAIVYDLFLNIDYRETAFLLKSIILWALVSAFTIIFLHINDKYGRGIFLKLLLGKYHQPREEERIFMFVDIKSSTTIAEELGHIRFFNLLNDFFRDATKPIQKTQGEIYQYVGDEIVVSWSLKNGVNNANCINCFYEMQKSIILKAPVYMDRYNLVPNFKAGLHYGEVTTGEIGVIKRDIVYSGDVLNTTARIESLCNLYGVKLLISKYLLDKLQLPPDKYESKRMGIIELKGKKQKVELYTFQNVIESSPPRTVSST